MSEHALLHPSPGSKCAAAGNGPDAGTTLSLAWPTMNIRFISSLTPEDEERVAPGILTALGMLLDQLPIAYTLRIETSGGRVFQHAHTAAEGVEPETEHLATRPLGGVLRPRPPVS